MSRNLITRMGTAGGVTAALVAAVFAVLVTAVRDQRSASRQARASEQVIFAAVDLRRAVTIVDLGRRGRLHRAPDVRAARAAIGPAERRLAAEVADEPVQRRRVAAVAARLRPWLAGGLFPLQARRQLDGLIAAARATADARAREADGKADLAIGLGIGGLAGSAILIGLLTAYLARYLVVPIRRTARAAGRVAAGDLGARVPEEGDAEPAELARAFNRMAVGLEESERLKDEFFALVSHELRTPLTSIIGYLELVLDDEQLTPEAREFLEVVERNARRLLRLVGDLLFVAQVEAGRLDLQTGEVDLAGLAAESVEAAQPSAQRGAVQVLLAAGAIRTVRGDHDRLGQMLDNLVSNALKFTPAGGRVEVRVREEAAHAVLEVVDTGAGIPENEQGELFERFARGSGATARAVPGAGLGLSIVRTIAEAHGGSVGLSSREGQGTTVRVELPLEREEAAAP